LKHESDESGIIIYDMHEDYSVGSSSSKKKKVEKEGREDISDSEQKTIDKEALARLGGFSGRVYDKLTYRTIEGVKVVIAKDLSVKTDERGNFTVFGIKPGRYRISISEEGYEIQSCISTAVAGETTKIESFHLVPSCLAAERPDLFGAEEGEIVEQEIVEFALEVPPAAVAKDTSGVPKPADGIKGETTTQESIHKKAAEVSPKIYPDSATTMKGHKEVPSDSGPSEIISKEEVVEYAESVFDEEIFAVFEKMTEAADEHDGSPDAVKSGSASFNEVLSTLIEQTEACPIAKEQSGVVAGTSSFAERQTPEADQQAVAGVATGTITRETVSAAIEEIVLEELSEDFQEIVPEKMIGETAEEVTLKEADVSIALFEETFERARRENQHAGIITEEPQPLIFLPELTKTALSMHGEDLIISETLPLEEFQGTATYKTTEKIMLPEEISTIAPEETWREPAPAVSLRNVQEISLEEMAEEIPHEFSIDQIPIEIIKEEPLRVAPVETTITETTQPEDIDRETLEEKEQVKLQWWKLRKKKPRESHPKEHPSSPPVDITLQIRTKQNIQEESQEQETYANVSSEEHKPSLTTEPPKRVLRFKPEETTPSKEPVITLPEKEQETTQDEESLQQKQFAAPSPAETAHAAIPSEEVPEETGETPLSSDVSLEETASEEVSENKEVTLSDQEKEAMSPDDNTTEEVEGFMGILSAQPNPAFKGLPITITYNLKNVSNDNPDDLLLQLIITEPATGTVHETFEAPIKCEKGAFAIGGFTLPTSSYEPNIYKVTMQLFSKKTKILYPVVDTPLQIKSIF